MNKLLSEKLAWFVRFLMTFIFKGKFLRRRNGKI